MADLSPDRCLVSATRKNSVFSQRPGRPDPHVNEGNPLLGDGYDLQGISGWRRLRRIPTDSSHPQHSDERLGIRRDLRHVIPDFGSGTEGGWVPLTYYEGRGDPPP